MPGDALALAMRIISCRTAGVDASADLQRLLEMQQVDGGWDCGWFYKYGSNGVLIANRGGTYLVEICSSRADLCSSRLHHRARHQRHPRVQGGRRL